MPELPDIELYVYALQQRVVGAVLQGIRLHSPFVLRTAAPSPASLCGSRVQGVERRGKRILLGMSGDRYVALHLMISGRLHWREQGAKVGGKIHLAAFDFENGTLVLTEASSRKRAALHLLEGRAAVEALAPAALEPLECTAEEFAAVLRRENHTVKRALTDPRLVSGIGNAYSDEILHAARLSPVKWTSRMSDEECARLYAAVRSTLQTWCIRLKADAAERWPDTVTAFRPGMAVHGRYRQPCPVCGAEVQRIVYAENECNYCAECQNGGRLLADRSMSRLLKDDWPRSLEELENRRERLMGGAE
jgi:formamidopyrimidine-DNA glycosylase